MRPINFKASDLSTEMQLLLACLRISPGVDDLKQIEKISRQALDWVRFINLTKRHGVAPLAYANLYRAGTFSENENALENLRYEYMRNSGRTMALAAELVRVLKLMQINEVLVIPFKGPVLAQEFYGNLALRQAGDLDVLVDKTAVHKFDSLIRNLGYHRTRPHSTLTRRQLDYFKFRNHHFQYRSQIGNISIELHWRLQLLPLLRHHAVKSLQKRGGKIEIAGFQVITLSTEDQLLNLCVHGAAHGWGHLFWLVDIAEIVRKHPDFKWNAFMISAKEQNAERAVGQGITLAHLLLNCSLPEPVKVLVQRDGTMRQLVKKAIQHIQKPLNKLAKSSEYGRLFYYRLMSSRSIRYKLLVILQFLFCLEDWQKLFKAIWRPRTKKRPPDVLPSGQA